MGNPGLSWWGSLFWLWEGVWGPGDLLGHWSHPVKDPQSQQWQSGAMGGLTEGLLDEQTEIITWAWVLITDVVLRSFLFYQIDLCLFIAWSWGWRRKEFQSVGEESGDASIYFWLQEKPNDRCIYTLKDYMFYDRESLRRDYLNIITLCLTVVLSRQSIMFSHLKFNYTVFIVLLKNIKGILSVNIQEQWMNNLNYKSKLNVNFISPKQAVLFC